MLEFYKKHYMKGNSYVKLAFDLLIAIILTATSLRFWELWAMKALMVLLWINVMLTLICVIQHHMKKTP